MKSLQPEATILHQGWYIGFKISFIRYPFQANIGPAYRLNFADISREHLHATILVSEQSFLGRFCQNKLAMCLYFTG